MHIEIILIDIWFVWLSIVCLFVWLSIHIIPFNRKTVVEICGLMENIFFLDYSISSSSRKIKNIKRKCAQQFDSCVHLLYITLYCGFFALFFNWLSFSFYFFVSFFRSGLHTDIFLVLIVSITCVQTKEIKNSSSIVFQQTSETHQNSSIETSSSSTPSDSRSQKNAFKNHIWPSTHQSINITTAFASNGSVSSQRTQQKSSNPHIQRTQTNSTKAPRVNKNFDITYSIDNNDNISLHNELAQFELPTMITSSKFYKSLKTSGTAAAPNEQTFARNAKHSNILRSALRAAARQGFEAMVDLYDKKEPNLISKGQPQFLFISNFYLNGIKCAKNEGKKLLYCTEANNNKNGRNTKRNKTEQ